MTANKNAKIGGLLLAAGGSSRLGHPKQLIVFEGRTLIRRSAEAIIDSGCEPVVVVLGAEIERCTAELSGLSIIICTNQEWLSGMGRSIATGLQELVNAAPDLDAILITLCDQPHVTSHHLKSLINEFKTSNAQIVAAKYDRTVGVPAVFSREIFAELISLNADKGARDIIQKHAYGVRTVAINAAIIDIDTEQDVARLKAADAEY